MIAGAGIFPVPAGLGHLREPVVNGNTGPGTAGPVMYLDILCPVARAILLFACREMAAKTGA